jgi:hypothetical protein
LGQKQFVGAHFDLADPAPPKSLAWVLINDHNIWQCQPRSSCAATFNRLLLVYDRNCLRHFYRAHVNSLFQAGQRIPDRYSGELEYFCSKSFTIISVNCGSSKT